MPAQVIAGALSACGIDVEADQVSLTTLTMTEHIAGLETRRIKGSVTATRTGQPAVEAEFSISSGIGLSGIGLMVLV